MKNFLTFLIVCFIFCVFAQGQNITNVYSEQDGKKINIFYTLDEESDISLSVSTDGGKTFSDALKNVTGDVDTKVSPGKKRIVWDVLADCEKLWSENVVFKVITPSKTFTVGGISFEMIYVKGGSFRMGCTSEQGSDCYSDEKPAHQVMLSDYYIGKSEVTQELWRAVMGSDPSELCFKGCDDCPVERVSWNDIQEFLRTLNAITGKRFRLPTEAEWEFAARGGNKSNGYKYSGSNTLGNVAWYTDNTESKTHPVGQKTPNELGIYDMSGNVWEWCQDWHGNYSSGSQTNPTGPLYGSDRVLRGGGWFNFARFCRVSLRNNNASNYRTDFYGFRVALIP